MNLKPSYELPSLQEMNWRKKKLLSMMKEAGLDAFVITDPDNVFWLTNFANYVHERPFILILSKEGKLRFLVPKLEVLHVKRRAIGELELPTYEEFPFPKAQSWDTVFKQETEHFSRIGVEAIAPQFVIEKLGERIYACEFLEEARYVKSEFEVSRILYSSRVVTQAMNKLLKIAKPGMSAIKSSSRISKLISLQMLADNPQANVLATKIGVIVQSPNVSDDPHNFTNLFDMDMQYGGPHVAVINSILNGYGTEVERTFFLGEVPKDAERPYQVMMEARQLALELCKPGADMHEVDVKVKEHFTQKGYGNNVIHRSGHSIGVTGHEGPFLAEGFHYEMKENMFFTVEPGIYIEGIGGFRHSDTIVITAEGNKSLTPVKDSLKDMTLSAYKLNLSLSAKNKQKLMVLANRYFGLNVH
ncbi:MAG: Xaa-Pro peptidase family protein [Bacteroidia bacterium]|nr:Xaa-Pro peptidase family protein [Bacteroidia bacterium]